MPLLRHRHPGNARAQCNLQELRRFFQAGIKQRFPLNCSTWTVRHSWRQVPNGAHEYEALGDCRWGHLHCWLTSFFSALATNLRKTLDTIVLLHVILRLCVPQFVVFSAFIGYQFVVGALLDDLTVIDNKNLVGIRRSHRRIYSWTDGGRYRWQSYPRQCR